jgi:hypothetical protein
METRLYNLWKRLTLIDSILLVLILVVAVGARALDLASTVIFVTAGTLMGWLVFTIVNYTVNWRRGITRQRTITSGNTWAHWSYDHNEWQQIIHNPLIQQHIQQQSKQFVAPLRQRSLIIGILFAVLMGFIMRGYGLQTIVGAILIGAGTMAILRRSGTRVEESLARPYQTTSDHHSQDVYIGEFGIAYGENHISFQQPRLGLKGAMVESEHPAILHLAFTYDLGNKEMPYDLFVPIPYNHENEAEAIAERLPNYVNRQKPRS